MNRFAALIVLCILSVVAIQACAQVTPTNAYSLDALQGGWWSDCNDPAVEFLIRGNEYSGDFDGSYKITLTGDVLMFNDGLIYGHSVNVTHKSLSFQILKVTDKQLVLRPLPGNPYIGDWHLQSCKDVPPNKSLQPTSASSLRSSPAAAELNR